MVSFFLWGFFTIPSILQKGDGFLYFIKKIALVNCWCPGQLIHVTHGAGFYISNKFQISTKLNFNHVVTSDVVTCQFLLDLSSDNLLFKVIVKFIH